MANNKKISVPIDEELLYKLRVVAKEEERSVNGQVLSIIKKKIENFEKDNGEIKR